MSIICNSRSLASFSYLLLKHLIFKCLAGLQNPSSQSQGRKRALPFFSLEQKAAFFLTESISESWIRVKMTNHWGHKHCEGQTVNALHKESAVFFFWKYIFFKKNIQCNTYNRLGNNGLLYGSPANAENNYHNEQRKYPRHQHEVFCL